MGGGRAVVIESGASGTSGTGRDGVGWGGMGWRVVRYTMRAWGSLFILAFSFSSRAQQGGCELGASLALAGVVYVSVYMSALVRNVLFYPTEKYSRWMKRLARSPWVTCRQILASSIRNAEHI